MAMAYAIQPEMRTYFRITRLCLELNVGMLRSASVRTDAENVTAIMDIDVGAYAKQRAAAPDRLPGAYAFSVW